MLSYITAEKRFRLQQVNEEVAAGTLIARKQFYFRLKNNKTIAATESLLTILNSLERPITGLSSLL